MSVTLETNRGDVLARFNESVRDFCNQALLSFSPEGVHLYGKDSAGIVNVQYNLPADKIRSEKQGNYQCNGQCIEVCIDTKMVAKCVSSVSCGDLVSFSVDPEENPDFLTIRCQNPVNGKCSNWTVITPTMFDDPVMKNSIEACGYNVELVMSSLLFHDMMRDLSKSDADSVRVYCDGSRLVLEAKGTHIKSSFEVKKGSEIAHFEYKGKESDKWPVIECFSMMNLERVAKAKNVGPQISIFLKGNFPIAFAYKADIGVLSYIISPRDDDDWMENPQLKAMPSAVEEIKGLSSRSRPTFSKKRGGGPASTIKIEAEEEEVEDEDIVSTDDDQDDEEDEACAKKMPPVKRFKK